MLPTNYHRKVVKKSRSDIEPTLTMQRSKCFKVLSALER